MPDQTLFPSFREEYEMTKYPFMDDASLVSTTTKQTIERDIFLDASLYPIGVTSGPLYISNVNVKPRNVEIVIADRSRQPRAIASFDPLQAADVLDVVDLFGRPAGVLVSDTMRLSRFTAWATGDHQFAPTATQFAPSCCIPTPESGVRGMMTEDGALFTGDLVIIGENGVVVRKESNDVIRIDVVGDPLFRRKLCTPVDLFTTPRFIRTINGCPPDKYGNFNLTVGGNLNSETILRIYKADTGLIVEAVGTTIQEG